MTKVKTEIVEMTPAKAMELIMGNENNRTMSTGVVKRYANIMKRDAWELNGESIKVADDGTLIDGQHRLQAVLETGKTVPMILVSGLNKDTFKTIDVGRKRTGADAIGVYFDESYRKHKQELAGAARIVMAFSKSLVYLGDRAQKWGCLEHDELIEFLENNKGLVRSADFVKSLHDAKKIFPLSCGIALHYLFSKKDPDLAEYYFHSLNTGANLSEHNAINHLRKRLFFMRQAGGRIQTKDVLPLAVKAWDLLRDEREVKNFRVDDEYIPVIK